MLFLRLYKTTAIVLKDKKTMKPIAQVFITDRSTLNFVDLSIDAIPDVIIHRENIPRKIEKIGDVK